MITNHFFLTLCLCFVATQGAHYYIDVDWFQISPVSNYVQVGDTVTWFSTNTSQSHWIVRVLHNFSGTQFGSIPQSDLVVGPALLNYSHTFTEADYAIEDQGFNWADLLNPSVSLFGVVHIARPDDVILNFHEFDVPENPGASTPPFAIETAIYPLNATIMAGQRVIFRDYIETYITHQISAGDGRNHLAACTTMPWVHTYSFTRNSLYWAWRFDDVGKFSWNCLVHPNEFGFIHVCEKHKVNGVWVPNPDRCGKWQRCENSQHPSDLADDEEVGHSM